MWLVVVGKEEGERRRIRKGGLGVGGWAVVWYRSMIFMWGIGGFRVQARGDEVVVVSYKTFFFFFLFFFFFSICHKNNSTLIGYIADKKQINNFSDTYRTWPCHPTLLLEIKNRDGGW